MATVTVVVTDQDGLTGECSFDVYDEATARATAASMAGYNYWPADDPTLTGVLTDTPRTLVQSLTTVPGNTYSNLILPFDYTPPAGADNPPVIFRNVEFIGTPTRATGDGALIKAWGANLCPVEVYDSAFKPQAPSPFRDAVRGTRVRVFRSTAERVVDGFGVYNTHDPAGFTDAGFYGNWVHNHAWWSQADCAAMGLSTPQDGSHPDGFQLQGGAGTILIGNRFENFIDPIYGPNFYGTLHGNACGMIRPGVGPITDLRASANYFDGGAFSLNCANWSASQQLGNIGSISDNRFGHNQRQQATGGDKTWTLNVPPPGTGIFENNTYADNGHPITVRHSA